MEPCRLRRYGNPPFRAAVIHGGPGAGGEMAPVARELASHCGVLEPIQTADSVDGQVEELITVLQKNGDPRCTLIGFSWGAWLAMITAARHPTLVKKLILIGSGPFEEKYASRVHDTRISRFNRKERNEFESLLKTVRDSDSGKNGALLARLGVLASKADAFDPLDTEPEDAGAVEISTDIFRKVWREAAALRRSGALLATAKNVQCPVTAIHGAEDPHPAEGVATPLAPLLPEFRFILLEKCGHRPWMEKLAKDKFYPLLKDELY